MTEPTTPTAVQQAGLPPAEQSPYPSTDAPTVQITEAQLFVMRLYHYTPKTYLTILLVLINVGIFGLMVMKGVSAIDPSPETMIGWGANIASRTTHGEWWRLLTSMFLHFGIIHLAFNMYVLWQIGSLTERLLGHAGFLVSYLLSGLVGALVSLQWNPANVASAGASGAVFGLFGALLGLLLRGKKDGSIPQVIFKQQINSGLLFIAINVAFGLSKSNIDMAAHFGGLAGGFLCGLALAHPLSTVGVSGRLQRAFLLAIVGGALVMGSIALIPRTMDLTGFRMHFFRDVEPKVLQTYNDATIRVQAGEINEKQFADIIDHDVLPPWRASQQAYHALHGRVSAKERQSYTLIGQYIDKRAEWWSSVATALRTGDHAQALRAETAKEQGDAAVTKLNELYTNK